MENKKKLGLIACIATGVGGIIGSGIFGALPSEINGIGSNVILAMILATVFELASVLPIMYSSTVMPTRGGFYVMSAKLIHPSAGVGVMVYAMLGPISGAYYTVLFADYFAQLVPSTADHKTAVAIVLLLLFCILAFFGNYIFASINSIAVVALVAVIGIYIFFGISGINANDINISSVLSNGIRFNSLAVAVNVFASCLTGASMISQIADEIENPRRNVPLSIIIATVSVSVIYILMALATLKYVGDNKIETLSEVASSFMPSSLVILFIICGPILGVLTSIAPTIMFHCSQLNVIARDGLLPSIFTKENKHGVAVFCLAYYMLISSICLIAGLPFEVLLAIVAALDGVIKIPLCIIPLEINKKYPYAAKRTEFRINPKFVEIVSVIVAVVSAYLAFTTFKSLGIRIWGVMLIYVIIILIYVAVRRKYMSNKGIDLMKKLAEPLKEWEEYEEKCRQLDLEQMNNLKEGGKQ